jgi:hypothetical protein
MVKNPPQLSQKPRGEVRKVYNRIGNQGGTLVTKLWFSIIHKSYEYREPQLSQNKQVSSAMVGEMMGHMIQCFETTREREAK